MNALTRMFRSMRTTIIGDAGFESYYGTLVRHLGDGAPNANEARRDFRAVRESMDRVVIF